MSFIPPDKQSLSIKYQQQISIYKPTMNKVKEIITEKIGSTNVKILGFTNRLKEFESFYDKILRDQIPDNYFTNMEDFIGARVMCVYYSDLEEIENLIEKNFKNM